MLTVNGNEIRVSRGNTAILDVAIENPDGSAYELMDGDRILFSLKKRTTDPSFIMQKEMVNGQIVFSDEELNLHPGKYVYDVKAYLADGREQTVIPPSPFYVSEVVNNE